MKKYVAAAAVAVMVFAFSAFAASLNVDGGVLQSGIDRDLTCAETAKVTYDHHVAYSDPNFNDAYITAVNVEFDDANDACVGSLIFLTIEGANGVSGMAVDQIVPGVNSFPLAGGPSTWPSIADVTGVSVTVTSDPGHYGGVPNNGQIPPFFKSGVFNVS
jgi:hypothetical protein